MHFVKAKGDSFKPVMTYEVSVVLYKGIVHFRVK